MLSGGLLVPLLVALAVGAAGYAVLYPWISGGARAEQRKREIALDEIEARRAKKNTEVGARRQQIEESLKQLEERQRSARRPPLSIRIQQAGLKISKRQFLIASGALALFVLAAGLIAGAPWYAVLAFSFAAAFGAPTWLLAFLKKRRETRFIDELPNAIDVIVRGVKAGLPIGDCIRIIASETQDPVRTEFRHIAESTAIGVPLGEACSKLYDRIPLPEANFFGIVVSIQQKSGGSLSEALGNLSRVLRERKKMKAKIKAMSMEAKASAVIIASLPIAVMAIVYMTSPNYIEILWTTPTGRFLLACSAGWMITGSLVMRRMINFDF